MSGRTCRELMVSYQNEMRQRRQSENTIKTAGFAFGHLESFLATTGKTIRDVQPDDLDVFRRHLLDHGLATTTVDIVLRQGRRFFRWLAENGEIFIDPGALWTISKPDAPLQSVPTEKEMTKLLAGIDITRPRGIRDRAMLETAYSTGTRLEELCNLTIFDADLDHGMLRVMGKGRKERMLPLGKQAVHWLRAYIRDARPKLTKGKLNEEKLWLGKEGEKMSAEAVRMMLAALSRETGLKRISPHALRRACATHMLQHGAHPVQIQLLLGHADLKTLSQYLRLTIKDIKRMHAGSNPGR